jgi:SNF2 family DNA or RNA helicase
MKQTKPTTKQDIVLTTLAGELSVLNERQQYLLCYIAYFGPILKAYEIDSLIDNLSREVNLKRYTKKNLEADISTLRNNGFITGYIYSSYFGEIFISSAWHIRTLYYLFTMHRNWLEAFRRRGKTVHSDVSFICTILRNALAGKPYADDRYLTYNTTYFTFREYIFILNNSVYRELAYLIPPSLLMSFIDVALDYYQSQDNDDYLPFLEEIVGKFELTKSAKSTFEEMFACARYFLNGEYKQNNTPKSFYGYILLGVHYANQTKYDEAVNAFEKGFRLYNKVYELKNLYWLFFASYYSVICYARCSTPTKKAKVEMMCKKMEQADAILLEPAHVLSMYYTNSKAVSRAASDMYASAIGLDFDNVKRLGYLITKHLGISGDFEKLNMLPPANHKIVLHEMRSVLNLPEKTILELNELYGDTPVLTAERHKEEWELTLDKILMSDSKESDNNPGAKSRIIYVIKNDEYIEFKEQSRLKSGAWSAGKSIPIRRFREMDDDCLDDTDRRVLSLSSHSNNYWDNDIDIFLPALVGCDRVFIFESSKYIPVTVDEEKPFLLLNKTNNGYQFTSNIDLSLLKNSSHNVQIYKKSRTHYTITRFNARQRKHYTDLLEIKAIPLSAEDKLRDFIQKIDTNLGVHSSSIEGAETLNSIEGDPEIVIRAYPSRSLNFTIDITARPVKGGKETFAPGKGSAIIMDEVDGERCQVKRKLSKEKRLFDNIRQVIEDITSRSFEAVELTGSEMLELIEYVREQEGYCLEWPKGEQIKLSIAQEKDWSIKMKKTGRWFEVEGNVQVNMDTMMSMSELLEAIANSSGKYVKLGEGDYMLISDTLRRQLERLNALSVNDRGKIKISPLQAAVGDDIFNGDSAIQVDEAWVKLRNKIIDSYGLKPRVPSTLKADLRDYQLEGYKWMKRLTDWGGGACLADDMGLGKTVQAIAYLLSEAKKGAALVVAPASVLPNWRNELERFAPTLNVKILNSSTDRAGDVSTAGPGDVVVTTYGLLVSEENMLVDKKWHTVCLDEAHAIKNRDTKMSKVAMQLDAKNRIAMTGTPIQNHLGELWNLFQFLNPGLLGTHEQFHKKFIVPIENEDNHGMQRHLKKIIAPFMLRRTKSEVVDELPDKTEIKISVDLTDEETAVYETIRVRAEQQLQEQNRVDVNVLAQITQLRRAACTPKLVNDSFKGESSKLDAFVSLVDEIASGGNKVLVFSQFTSFLQLAKEQLDKAGIKYLYFDGSTTIAKREKIIEQFRSGEVQLFLISLKAGGLGLNLTEANYVIHLDPWWNPAIEQQATDRAYRIGQKQKVTVYHLISAHTIEEKILRLHAVKRDLADQLLEGTNISHKLTAKDLLEMLSTAE